MSAWSLAGRFNFKSGRYESLFRNIPACFVAGTPLRTPDGLSRPIEAFVDGDAILTRPEGDPAAAAVAGVVSAAFVRVSPVLNVHVGGGIIGTTKEHPFWVRGSGWTNAADLRIGDELLTSDGRWVPCGGVADSGRVATVYNLEVAGSHTYFVGDGLWGFDVWAHNAKKCVTEHKASGTLREHRVEDALKSKYPGADIQKERYLRGADGRSVVDKVTNERRRVDFVVVKDGKAIATVEVTSATAGKVKQLAKEDSVRNLGGTMIRHRTTRELIPVPKSQVVRVDLESGNMHGIDLLPTG